MGAAGCPWPSGGPRARHRAPRSQAGESVPHQRRTRQDPGLRPREALERRRGRPIADEGPDHLRHRARRHRRDDAVHGAGAGEGAAGRSPCHLFAFGVVLYEMASGKSPFSRPSGAEAMSAVLTDTPPPLDEVRPACRRFWRASPTTASRRHPNSGSSPRATSCSRSIPPALAPAAAEDPARSRRREVKVPCARERLSSGGCRRRPRHGLVGRLVSNPARDGAGVRTGHEAGCH